MMMVDPVSRKMERSLAPPCLVGYEPRIEGLHRCTSQIPVEK